MGFGSLIGSRRLSANKVRVQVKKNGQYIVTIPRSLALASGLSSDSIGEWEYTQRGLIFKKKTEE